MSANRNDTTSSTFYTPCRGQNKRLRDEKRHANRTGINNTDIDDKIYCSKNSKIEEDSALIHAGDQQDIIN
jgi:hypothetical protein